MSASMPLEIAPVASSWSLLRRVGSRLFKTSSCVLGTSAIFALSSDSLTEIHADPRSESSDDWNATIQSLPPELLHVIFAFAIRIQTALQVPVPSTDSGHDLLSTSISGSPPEDIHTLLRINGVCRYWRSVATSSPTLWTYLSPTISLQLTALFIERSKSLPLAASVCDSSHTYLAETRHRNRSNAYLVLSEIQRIRSLYVSAEDVTLMDIEFPDLDSRVCPIESLIFAPCSRSLYPENNKAVDLMCSLLSQFHTPALSSVQLSGTHVPWEFLRKLQLTSLSLTMAWSKEDVMTEMHDLLNLNCRNMEFLSLDIWQLQSAESEYADSSNKLVPLVELPHLRQIVLKGSCRQCSDFLRTMRTPALRDLQIINDGEVPLEGREILPATYSLPHPDLDYLRIELDSDMIRLNFGSVAKCSKEVAFRFYKRYWLADLASNARLLLSILQQLDLSSIKKVDLPMLSRLGERCLNDILLLLPTSTSIFGRT